MTEKPQLLLSDSGTSSKRPRQTLLSVEACSRIHTLATYIPTGTVRRLTDGLEPIKSVAWETYADTQGTADERIMCVLVQGGKEFTYSIEENGANNNPWER